MKITSTEVPGSYIVESQEFIDNRGSLVKTFHNSTYQKSNIDLNFKEEYYSTSTFGVLRGLHFQVSPYASSKLIYCIDGEILDVIVDLRYASPTYKIVNSFDLSSKNKKGLFIPAGIAHGFYTLSEKAIIVCKCSEEYHPEYESGILWSSIDFNWPNKNPIISEKDEKLISLQDYTPIFNYENLELV